MHGDDVAEVLRPRTFEHRGGRVEKEAALPGFDDDYTAAGKPEAGEVSCLVLVMGRDGFKAGGEAYHFLQYVHISKGVFGFVDDGHWFTFLWSDVQPQLVTVYGRNLLRICHCIGQRRMPWIRVADRDFRASVAPTEPIITRITLENWKRQKKG